MSTAEKKPFVVWACALLVAALQTVAQPVSSSGSLGQQAADAGGKPDQQIVATKSVPIRNRPPTPWLLGFPGWRVAQTEAKEHYKLLRTLEIQVFSSTHAWAEVELASPSDATGIKSGWVYWGESFRDDGDDFEYATQAGSHSPAER